MKTTLELPEALVKQVKLRALQDGKKLKDTIAELLQRGLAAPEPKTLPRPRIKKHPQTGLPIIGTRHAALLSHETTPERVHEILLEQEVEWAK